MNMRKLLPAVTITIALLGGVVAIWIAYLAGGLQGRSAGEAYRALAHQNLEVRAIVLALEALERNQSEEVNKHLNYLLDDVLSTRAEFVQRKPLVFATSAYRELPDRDYLARADADIKRYVDVHPAYEGPAYDRLIDAEDAVVDSGERRKAFLAQWEHLLAQHMSLVGKVYSCDAFPYGDVDTNICETFENGHEYYLTVAFYDKPGGEVIARAPVAEEGSYITYIEGGDYVDGYVWAKYRLKAVEGYLPYDRWRMFRCHTAMEKLNAFMLSIAKRFSPE